MDMLVSLWLPILLSAVCVFVASSIIWMALPIHKKDYKDPGAKEADILEAVNRWSLEPGVYPVPHCKGGSKPDAATMEKMKKGPWAMVTVIAEGPNMGKMLGMWIVNLLLVSFMVAYVGAATMPAGTEYLKVFQVIGGTAFLAYTGNALTMSIWQGMPWSQLPGRIFDGVVYALLTAGVFGWLWPKAEIVLPIINPQ